MSGADFVLLRIGERLATRFAALAVEKVQAPLCPLDQPADVGAVLLERRVALS